VVDDCGIGVRFPSEPKIFLFLKKTPLSPWSPPIPLIPGIRRLEIEAVHIRLLQCLGEYVELYLLSTTYVVEM
jgi:hypothetical protein